MNEGLMGFLPFIVIFVLFYFMLIRPQMKQAKEHKAMIASLKNGDEISTGSGILGKITKLNTHYAAIESAKAVEIKIQRRARQASLSSRSASTGLGLARLAVHELGVQHGKRGCLHLAAEVSSARCHNP